MPEDTPDLHAAQGPPARTGPIPPRLGHRIRVRHRVWLPLAIVYAASFLLPTISPAGDGAVSGYRAFSDSIRWSVEVIEPHIFIPWLANPLFVAGVVEMTLGYFRRAAMLGTAAMAAAIVAARGPFDAAWFAIDSGELWQLVGVSGYFAWLSGMIGLVLIAVHLAARREDGRFLPGFGVSRPA